MISGLEGIPSRTDLFCFALSPGAFRRHGKNMGLIAGRTRREGTHASKSVTRYAVHHIIYIGNRF